VLQREQPSHAAVAMQSLAPGERLTELLGHSFCARIVAPLGLAPRRFAALAEIARRIPVRRLVLPNEIKRLPEVSNLIEFDPGL
jgi:hypothetical protein